jgi:Uncharacterized protein conserved in bacteria
VSGVVVDTSAMVAIVAGESGASWLADELSKADERMMAAPNVLELGIVLESRAPAAVGIAHRAIRDARIIVEQFSDDLAERAIEGWRRFGKGRHKAALNFGDCCTYALAEQAGLPILCTGTDFSRTDLAVLSPPVRRSRRQ